MALPVSRNKAEIRLSIFVQRGGHTDDDDIHVGQARKVCRRAKIPCKFADLDLCGRNSVDVGPARVESCNLMLVDVKTSHSEVLFRVEQSKRQARRSRGL